MCSCRNRNSYFCKENVTVFLGNVVQELRSVCSCRNRNNYFVSNVTVPQGHVVQELNSVFSCRNTNSIKNYFLFQKCNNSSAPRSLGTSLCAPAGTVLLHVEQVVVPLRYVVQELLCVLLQEHKKSFF